MIYILPFDINRLIKEKQTEIDELIDDYKKEPGSSELESDNYLLKLHRLEEEKAAFVALKDIMKAIDSIRN